MPWRMVVAIVWSAVAVFLVAMPVPWCFASLGAVAIVGLLLVSEAHRERRRERR